MIFLLACGDDSGSITEPSDESSSSVVQSSSSAKTKKSSSSSFAKSSSGKKTSSSSKKNEQSSSSTNRSSSSVVLSSSDKRSSSSVASSSARSSSSSVPLIVDPSTVVVDSIIDSRDGQTYKTVSIGAQTWMAENLNFKTDSSFCYNNEETYCTKYGRLYRWAAAMDSAGTWSANGKGCGDAKRCTPTYPVRGVCPTGWHLPTKAEFETLFTAVGGSSTAGKMLKSTSGWNSGGNGTDNYSFSALPAGDRYDNEGYDFEGSSAFIWSSTEYGSYGAYCMDLDYDYDDAYLGYGSKHSWFSVRCLKD